MEPPGVGRHSDLRRLEGITPVRDYLSRAAFDELLNDARVLRALKTLPRKSPAFSDMPTVVEHRAGGNLELTLSMH